MVLSPALTFAVMTVRTLAFGITLDLIIENAGYFVNVAGLSAVRAMCNRFLRVAYSVHRTINACQKMHRAAKIGIPFIGCKD